MNRDNFPTTPDQDVTRETQLRQIDQLVELLDRKTRHFGQHSSRLDGGFGLIHIDID